jgi:hypothetical protein
MIDNFAIYHGSTIKAGYNIWLPSPDYVRMLQKSGVIGSRPGWINVAVDIGKGIAGFHAGVVSGIFGSLWDTLTGLWELGKGIVNTVRSVLDGSIFASIESIYDTITEMKWPDLKKMVDSIITMGKSAFSDFKKKWYHPNTYKQWHFKGYIVGAIALEVILAIFTGGATLGVKVLAKIGKYLPKLMRIFNKLLALAKKLPGRRGKGRRGKGRRGKGRSDTPEKGKDRDRDKDDKDMSKDDRAWEQARVMAAMVTEEHDIKDTPVAKLIAKLKATIAARFKVVHGYRAIRLGSPNTYKIIQMARRKIVDKHYTEERTKLPPWKGPVDYSSIPNPKSGVGPRKKFTNQAHKKRLREHNKKINDGHMRSDIDGSILDEPGKDVSPGMGGSPKNWNRAEVDHKIPRSDGGANTSENARIISAKQNEELRKQM